MDTAARVEGVVAALKELMKLPVDELIARRYDKLCAMGRFSQ